MPCQFLHQSNNIKNIKCQTCDFVQARKVEDYCAVLSWIIFLYAKAVFNITCIYGNIEYGPVI